MKTTRTGEEGGHMNGFCCWLLQCLAEYFVALALNIVLKLLKEMVFEKRPTGRHFRKTK